MKTTNTTKQLLNGLDPQAVQQLIDTVAQQPQAGMTRWSVNTRWTGGATTTTRVTDCRIGDQAVTMQRVIDTDEPMELGGTNTMPNPQQYLMAAVNACMMVTYVTLATLQGIELESLEIDTTGDIDLRGLFGLDESVNPGYDELEYMVRMKGDATEEQFRQIHEMVKQTSPNFHNMARAVTMNAKLEVM